MKIWQWYLLRQLAFTFALFLFCVFAVYVFIDLSIHGVRFLTLGSGTSAFDLFLYYLRQFAVHLDLFLPLAFLLSMYRVLFLLSGHLELVALQMAGISRKRLLQPFFFFAAFLSIVGYLNHEYFTNQATAAAVKFKISHSKSKKKRAGRVEHFQTMILDDQSELVYQSNDLEKKELFDVFWIRSDKDIWHMKTLSFAATPPTGHFVDHLVRENKLLEKQESFREKIFSEFPLNQNIIPKPFVPFEGRALSTLFFEASIPSVESPSIKTHLHHKLALPLLPLLIVFGAAPFALTFSRQRRTFLIVSISLLGFLACHMLFDSLLILGENKVLPPEPAMWFCPALIAILSLRRFAKL
jgi:lipopolysaccharide export LptBFGC system permease protein LptF